MFIVDSLKSSDINKKTPVMMRKTPDDFSI